LKHENPKTKQFVFRPISAYVCADNNEAVSAVDTSSHIHRDVEGRAWIDDTNIKVIEVVLDHIAYGWSADEIHVQHPHLSLAQIHAALSYYFDHQQEFDRLIEDSLGRANTRAASTQDSPGRRRLRALGKLH
jgi:uncharacterized protein (DUF433 family)